MSTVDLTSADLAWFEASIAGAEKKARMSMLRQDEARGVRTVLVEFPHGWRRDAVGTQPAGEEMVPLSGALSISGVTVSPGQFLVITPRALRSATSTVDGTRAVVWFSGPGGGWADGEELVTGTLEVHDPAHGFVREETDGLHGRVEVRDDVAGAVLDQDVEVVWPGENTYAVVAAGDPVPSVAGSALVRFLT